MLTKSPHLWREKELGMEEWGREGESGVSHTYPSRSRYKSELVPVHEIVFRLNKFV